MDRFLLGKFIIQMSPTLNISDCVMNIHLRVNIGASLVCVE